MYVLAMTATALALGGMLFFTAVMAPLVFTQLPVETAGPFIRKVFPWYYLYVIITSGIAAPAWLPENLPAAAIMGVVCVLGVYGRQRLMPQINRLRDTSQAGDTDAGKRFDRRHRLSVIINAGQLFAVAAVFIRGLL